MKKYKIKSTPNLKNGGVSAGNSRAYPGNMIYPVFRPDQWSAPTDEVRNTLGPVPRDESDIEAEKGETVYIPNVQGLAAHFKVGGKRHSEGGTPLALPSSKESGDPFVMSDTLKMRIKDSEILAMFGKSEKGKKSYTPAELAKQYDINKNRLVLDDKANNSDDIYTKTAEKNIGKYNLKLGKLALVQEAKKGFPDSIPMIALPYLAVTGIQPEDVLPLKLPENQQSNFKFGGNTTSDYELNGVYDISEDQINDLISKGYEFRQL